METDLNELDCFSLILPLLFEEEEAIADVVEEPPVPLGSLKVLSCKAGLDWFSLILVVSWKSNEFGFRI